MSKRILKALGYSIVASVIFAILTLIWGCNNLSECEYARRMGLDKDPAYREAYCEKCGCE